jgi:hypothetical protein
VDVPAWASAATNILAASGNVVLLFNQNALPGANPSDIRLLGPSTGGSVTLTTNGGVPLLLPGQRYYLAVTNATAASVNFTVEVDFNIITLTNRIPYTNSLAAFGQPTYYQYDVSTNAIATAFEILNPSGNVDLVARKGVPLPTLASFDYISSNPGTNDELILVLTNSAPVPLTPGRWYLGVFNSDVLTVNYTILAAESGPPQIIPLTNGVPFNYSSFPGLLQTNFFVFAITNTNSAALFELYNLSANADLNLDRAVLPYAPPFFQTSANPGTNSQQIVIRTNLLGTNINDNWFLSVPDLAPSNVTYTIRAVVATNGMLISGIPISVTETLPPNSTNGPILSWPSVLGESYEVLATTNLALPTSNWTVIATITNAPAPLTTFTSTNPVFSQPLLFYQIQQIPVP